jgi:dephospho-CoA kinase
VTYVVGLTGGIGSGKSEVAAAFAKLAVEIVDADVLAHELSARGQAGHAEIVAAFGPGVLAADGTLDRAQLRQRAFANVDARHTLEAILHPKIRARTRDAVARWQGAYGVLVVPLLLEKKGLGDMVDRVLVVDCAEDEQIRRVMARSGLTEPEVRAIMATQLDRARRLASADDVLDNSGARDRVAPQVEVLDRRYRQLAAQKKVPH